MILAKHILESTGSDDRLRQLVYPNKIFVRLRRRVLLVSKDQIQLLEYQIPNTSLKYQMQAIQLLTGLDGEFFWWHRRWSCALAWLPLGFTSTWSTRSIWMIYQIKKGICQNCKMYVSKMCLVYWGLLLSEVYPNHRLQNCHWGFLYFNLKSQVNEKVVWKKIRFWHILVQVDPGSSDTLLGGNCKFWFIINSINW